MITIDDDCALLLRTLENGGVEIRIEKCESWKPVLAGFILFRAFDMLKPPPIRSLERLPRS